MKVYLAIAIFCIVIGTILTDITKNDAFNGLVFFAVGLLINILFRY